ncbi:MAG: CDP-glucose 4,6-dehydratase, partial [Planctomycetota bacterium]
QRHWDRIVYQRSEEHNLHEAKLLKLDSSKARLKLGWSSVWGINKTLEMTAKWYRCFYGHHEVLSEEQLTEYTQAINQRCLKRASL